jgi:VanZ family protein
MWRKIIKNLESKAVSYKILLIGWLLAIYTASSIAQTNNNFFTPSPVQNNSRLIPLVVAQGGLYAGSMVGLNLLWYKNYAHSPFHLFNDNKEWLQMDKLGHLLTAYTLSRIMSSLYFWSGLNHARSNDYGVALGMAYQTNIEIFDGFSSAWGFSIGDMIANTAGASLYGVQEATWGEQRITMKISFHPSMYAEYRPDELGYTTLEQSIKDYNGQTYWAAFAIAAFLPKGNKVPNWLCLDFGYGAEGMTGGNANPVIYNGNGDEMFFDRYRQYYCSLDIDLTRIPTNSGPLKALFGTISFIKVPMPTLEFSRRKFKFHLLYF